MEMQKIQWGYFTEGTIHIICSSHNDIAWFDTPAATMSWRDEKSITPALERMAVDESVYFSMENVLYLLEYLEHHPERFDEIQQLALDKRFDWGATYNQPYESLLSSEQLVRQVYLGRKLLKKLFPGVDPRVYYSPDVPARAKQMPQILAKADIPYMLISRHKPSLQYWESPDGSRVMSWSMGHYAELALFTHLLDKDIDTVTHDVADDLRQWNDDYKDRGIPKQHAYLYSFDYIPPKDYDALIETWNGRLDDGRPEMRYSTPEQFFDAIAKAQPELETIKGERPLLWIYIHGPAHHHAISAKREAGVLLPAAETFATINALLEKNFQRYPQSALTRTWANAIYDDHGWGGNNGHITDEVFRQKLVAARDGSKRLLTNALEGIAERIDHGSTRGVPVVVFNALSWKRTEPVRCTVPSIGGGFDIVDENGMNIPFQLISPTTGLETEVEFVADKVPSIGYRSYYARHGKLLSSHAPDDVKISDTAYENRFYRIELAAGGIKQIFDKVLGYEILRTDKLLGAEVFMLDSPGTGAGEFNSIQQPSAMADFERMARLAPEWKITENGPVFVTYTLQQQLSYCLVVQRLIFYHDIKRIDCEVNLINWNGTKCKEMRIGLPINIEDASIAYEVPMGIVEIGQDELPFPGSEKPIYSGYSSEDGLVPQGPHYVDDCRTIHPRSVQNFITAWGKDFGVTLSSPVAVFDWIDPMLFPAPYPILQPILFASRKSCHRNGNWYLQAGDHQYRFSILSHDPEKTGGMHYGIGSNNRLHTIVDALPASQLNLPTNKSFASISADNVIISALKKAEDDDSVILRCYEVAGEDTQIALTVDFAIDSAEQTNIIEEGSNAVPFDDRQVNVTIGHHAIETFRLSPVDN